MKVTYTADDGAVFETKEACELHERGAVFAEYARASHCPVSVVDMVPWLEAHAKAVRAFVAPEPAGKGTVHDTWVSPLRQEEPIALARVGSALLRPQAV